MISIDRLIAIEKEIEKNPDYIYSLSDAELLSYESYTFRKIQEKKKNIKKIKENCKVLLNKIKNK